MIIKYLIFTFLLFISIPINGQTIDDQVIALKGDAICLCIQRATSVYEVESCYLKEVPKSNISLGSYRATSLYSSEEEKKNSNTYRPRELIILLKTYVKKNCSAYKEVRLKFYGYPINFDDGSLKKINKKKYKKWTKNNIALDGIVTDIKKIDDSQYFKIDYGKYHIWVVLANNEKPFSVGIGEHIRAIGILTVNDTVDAGLHNDMNFYISAFGMVETKSGNLVYDLDYEYEINQWKEGELPPMRN